MYYLQMVLYRIQHYFYQSLNISIIQLKSVKKLSTLIDIFNYLLLFYVLQNKNEKHSTNASLKHPLNTENSKIETDTSI